MQGQGKYKATMFLAIWQGNFIGIGFGAWLFKYAETGASPCRTDGLFLVSGYALRLESGAASFLARGRGAVLIF